MAYLIVLCILCILLDSLFTLCWIGTKVASLDVHAGHYLKIAGASVSLPPELLTDLSLLVSFDEVTPSFQFVNENSYLYDVTFSVNAGFYMDVYSLPNFSPALHSNPSSP
jgi:hypothetical protein